MRGSTYTGLTLFEWAEILGISPWEMGQIGNGFSNPSTAQCAHVFYQFPYQRDFLSREEILRAIDEAENALAEQLGYWTYPKFFVDEVIQYPRPHQSWLYGVGKTIRDDWKTVQLRWHKVLGAGLFNRTVVANSVAVPLAVTYSDVDNDGIDDTFTVTATTTVTDADEIGVYVQAADRLGEAVSEIWRIRPVKVSISGGTATITGHSALMVLPELTTNTNPQNLTVTDPAIYISNVEVYRVFRDDTATSALPYQGVAEWDEIPDCDADCEFEIKEICIAERNNAYGQVAANWGIPSSWPQPRQPDRLSLNYQAGVKLESGRMNKHWARIVAYLATAMLPSESCGCERSNRILHYWRALPNATDKPGAFTRPITLKEIDDNPFGDGRGAIWAWKQCRELRNMGVVSL
jgi:hypothetical protein